MGDNTMRVGSTVTFQHGYAGEEIPIVAIVTGIHPDGSLQLYAFRHDSTQFIYSLPADRCTELRDDSLWELAISLRERVDNLQEQLDELTAPSPSSNA